jgi:hypothetical protein
MSTTVAYLCVVAAVVWAVSGFAASPLISYRKCFVISMDLDRLVIRTRALLNQDLSL